MCVHWIRPFNHCVRSFIQSVGQFVCCIGFLLQCHLIWLFDLGSGWIRFFFFSSSLSLYQSFVPALNVFLIQCGRRNERTCVLGPIQLFAFYHSISGWNCIRVIDNKQSNKQNVVRFLVWCSRKMAFHVPESFVLCAPVLPFHFIISIINFFFYILFFSSSLLTVCFYIFSFVRSFDIVFYVLRNGCYHRQPQTLPIAHMPHVVRPIHIHVKYGSICLLLFEMKNIIAEKSVTSWRCRKETAGDNKKQRREREREGEMHSCLMVTDKENIST